MSICDVPAAAGTIVKLRTSRARLVVIFGARHAAGCLCVDAWPVRRFFWLDMRVFAQRQTLLHTVRMSNAPSSDCLIVHSAREPQALLSAARFKMQYVSLVTLACIVAFSAPVRSAESALSQYRGVTLGDSLQVVVDRLHLEIADVKVVHDRPALVQQVIWRPRPFFSGSSGEADSVAEIILTFHTGQLAQIAVTYDRERTQGLTNADLHEAMRSAYGPSMLLATPTQPTTAALPDKVTIGRWEDPQTLLILWREQFPTRIGLTITSVARDAALQQAIADGVRVEAEGAPARDLARRAAEAQLIRERDEKIRLDNKTKFKP